MADPLSVAGAVLGAASLAIQLFDGAKIAYSYFEVAADVHGECESLRLRLRIEYARLLDWADIAGLSDKSEHEAFNRNMRMNRPTIMALLAEISALLTNMRHSSLQETDAVFDSNQQTKQSMAKADFEKFQAVFDASKLPRKKRKHYRGLNHLFRVGEGMRTIASDSKTRFRWAAFDREKFIGDLRRLRELTNYLHETVGEHKMDLLVQTTNETQLAMVQLVKDVGEMKALLRATEESTFSAASGEEFHSETSTIAVSEPKDLSELTVVNTDALIGRLASFRIHLKQVTDSKNLNGLRVETTEIEIREQGEPLIGNRSLATYKSSPVWVEWKKAKLWLSVDGRGCPKSDIEPRLEENIQKLTTILGQGQLPKEFRVPQCLCYFLDENEDGVRVGLVYQYPEPMSESSRPITLLQLLGNRKPALQYRMQMAQYLASSLLYLHSVNWLHKSLNSTSVLFFQAGERVNLDKPYISGFEHARPDEGETITGPGREPEMSQLYWHPDYLEEQNDFRKTYDIYSLGIVLIEIALWKPASTIFDISKPSEINKEKLQRIRSDILSDDSISLQDVRSSMGERYCDATRTCIEGLERFGIKSDAKEDDPTTGAMIQQAFLHLVVDVLNTIVV